MNRRLRVALITLCLVIAGFTVGVVAIGGGGALALLLNPSDLGRALLGFEAAVGGVLGAVLLPAVAWGLLRRTPVWQVLVGPAVGAGAGAFLEWTLLRQSTFAGAAAGATVAVLVLVAAAGVARRAPGARRSDSISSTDSAALRAAGGPDAQQSAPARVHGWLTNR